MDLSLMQNITDLCFLPGERTSARADEVMDSELQAPFLRLNSPQVSSFMLNDAVDSLSDNMQASVGLMRLHSAPSSMLVDPVDAAGDEFLSTGSRPLSHDAVGADFSRFFPDNITCHPVQFESKGVLRKIAKSRVIKNGGVDSAMESEQRIGDRSRFISQHRVFNHTAANGIVEDANRSPLSAILEHGAEVSSENLYGNSQIPLSVCRQQGARAVVGFISESAMNCFTSLSQSETNLVRHLSSPAGLISRLATEAQSDNSEVPDTSYAGSMMRPSDDCLPERVTTTRTTSLVLPSSMKNSFEPGRGMNSDDLGALSSNKSELLRQSSSPAGLLSQLNLDGRNDVLPTSSGNSSEEGSFDKRGGLPFLPSFPWDDSVAAPGRGTVESSNGFSTAARKRIREVKYFAESTPADPQRGDALEHVASAKQFSLPTVSNPETPFCPDKLPSDSVLCRARAKRGCATHPRSIAERVRRTKISERMRKLQELVPNMDKQTNTADMLDEAVEYVKLLQRQVQELMEKQSKCDGSCKKKTPSSK